MSKNQKKEAASFVEMDARTLLRTINSGALSQHKIFEDKVKAMGESQGSNFVLTTLNQNNLVFEDVDLNQFYTADIKRLKGGKYRIDNIKPIKVVEEQKKGYFQKSCLELVEAIAEGKQKDAMAAFDKISKQHFRSKVIPNSGWVTTRDQVARHITVNDDVVPSDIRPKIIEAITENLSDTVKIKDGQIVESTFYDSDEKFQIPITELTRRKVVARFMKESAQKAWQSPGFQNRIGTIAGLVSKDQITEAVRITTKFLKEEQEFCLLTLKECQELASNALAAKGIFNDALCEDVGKLFYRANCKLNRDTILEGWKKTARRAAFTPLVENVKTLEESNKFEDDYNDFLNAVFFEDSSTREVRRNAYRNSLEDLRKVLEGTTDEDVIGSLDDYIVKLGDNEIDDATLYEVEDLLASISNELVQDVRSLADYDKIPEPPQADQAEFGNTDLASSLGAAGGPGTEGPAIPLPIGGGPDIGEPMGIGAEPMGMGAEPMGMGAEPMGMGAEQMPLAADVNKDGQQALSEGELPDFIKKKQEEKKNKKESESDEQEDTDEGEEAAVECESYVGLRHKTPISEMSARQLNDELEVWRLNGRKYFKESGPDVCSAYINAYTDRAMALNNSKIAENFEGVLGSALLEDDDPYPYQFDFDTNVVNRDYGSIEEEDASPETYGRTKKDGVMKPGKPQEVSGKGSEGTPSNSGAPKGKAKMDQKGTGLASKVKKGKTDDGAHSSPQNAVSENSEGMDNLGGKPAITSKSAKKVSGRDGTGANGSGSTEKMGNRGGSTVASKDPHKISGKDGAGTKGGSRTETMDKKGGKGVASSSLNKSDGRSYGSGSDKADNMSEASDFAPTTRRRRSDYLGDPMDDLDDFDMDAMAYEDPAELYAGDVDIEIEDPEVNDLMDLEGLDEFEDEIDDLEQDDLGPLDDVEEDMLLDPDDLEEDCQYEHPIKTVKKRQNPTKFDRETYKGHKSKNKSVDEAVQEISKMMGEDNDITGEHGGDKNAKMDEKQGKGGVQKPTLKKSDGKSGDSAKKAE